jgi:DnaJ-class molecular chaperone
MTVITTANFEQCRAAYGDGYLIDHGYARLVPCERCSGSGEVIKGVPCSKWSDPADAEAAFPCPECEGAGLTCVMTEPVTMTDLDRSAPPSDGGREQ